MKDHIPTVVLVRADSIHIPRPTSPPLSQGGSQCPQSEQLAQADPPSRSPMNDNDPHPQNDPQYHPFAYRSSTAFMYGERGCCITRGQRGKSSMRGTYRDGPVA